MNKRLLKITISSFIGLLLLFSVAYVVYALTHKTESKDNAMSAVTMEQPIVEVDTIALRKQTFQKQKSRYAHGTGIHHEGSHG